MPSPKANKRKGKAFEVALRNYLRDLTGLDEDITNAVGSENAVDIKLSPAARKVLPLSIEAKNRRGLDIPAWMRQAESNTLPGTRPCVVLKNPRQPIGDSIVIMRLDDLLGFLGLPTQENDNEEE